MCIVEVHDKDNISFPGFLSTKQGHESKETKTKTFFLVEALKRAFLDVSISSGLNFSLEVFLLYVHVVYHHNYTASEFMDALKAVTLIKKRRPSRLQTVQTEYSFFLTYESLRFCV